MHRRRVRLQTKFFTDLPPNCLRIRFFNSRKRKKKTAYPPICSRALKIFSVYLIPWAASRTSNRDGLQETLRNVILNTCVCVCVNWDRKGFWQKWGRRPGVRLLYCPTKGPVILLKGCATLAEARILSDGKIMQPPAENKTDQTKKLLSCFQIADRCFQSSLKFELSNCTRLYKLSKRLELRGGCSGAIPKLTSLKLNGSCFFNAWCQRMHNK